MTKRRWLAKRVLLLPRRKIRIGHARAPIDPARGPEVRAARLKRTLPRSLLPPRHHRRLCSPRLDALRGCEIDERPLVVFRAAVVDLDGRILALRDDALNSDRRLLNRAGNWRRALRPLGSLRTLCAERRLRPSSAAARCSAISSASLNVLAAGWTRSGSRTIHGVPSRAPHQIEIVAVEVTRSIMAPLAGFEPVGPPSRGVRCSRRG